jgi:tRNA (adenine57-N1/adenine58-N1)-methyltransferase
MNFLACNGPAAETSTSNACIREGDLVVVYEGHSSMKAVYVSAKGRFENRFGVFSHQASRWAAARGRCGV